MNKETQLSTSQEYWEKIRLEAPVTAISKSEEAAKQLIALTSLLSTIYFGIASFNDVLKQTITAPSVLLFALPLPFWLGSLTLATRVIVPRSYVVTDVQADYVEISHTKHRYLRWSYTLLIASMFVLLIDVIIYLLRVPPPAP